MEETSVVTLYGFGVALSALLSLLLAHVLRRAEDKKAIGTARVDLLDLALWCIPCALVGARLCYCLGRFTFYFSELGPLSVLRVWEGGFMLYGAALGALLAAALLASRRGVSVASTLDELAAPGLLAVAVCRLFEGSTGEGVGTWVEQDWQMRFPIAIRNEYDEWQLAVFLLEALAALILLLIVLRVQSGRGERIMTAVLAYACCQVVLESLRMDGCLKIGFVRISQVLSAVAILAVTMIRAMRAGGKQTAVRRFVVVAACTAVVGVIEWALDKTMISNVILYAAMGAMCALLYANGSRFKQKVQARI